MSLINKVRSYVRKFDYLLYPFQETEHLSIDGKRVLHEHLVHFSSIAKENVNKVIEARLSGDIIALKPVYVTEKDYEEANKIEHLTKDQIKVKLFQIMDTLPTAEGALQQEQFQKLVKDCSKSTYIELFNEICNLQRDLVVEQDETISTDR